MRFARVFSEVHAMASRYHWSQAEILSLTLWRRQKYLALIEREAADRMLAEFGDG